ncbi:MAG: DUF362 domain-containing protein [Candidatus Omnitrophota bacterium]
MTKVSLVKCKGYDAADVTAAVRHAVDLLGGMGKFVGPNKKVLLKPNLLTDAAPEAGITTHPEVLRAVIRLLKPLTKNIYCGDSPSVWGEHKDIDRVYEVTGTKDICREEGVELVYFTTPKLYRTYPLTDWLDKCDRLISIPKFKTHGLTVLTAGIKNLFGLVVGMHKMKIHYDYPRPQDLCKALVDLYEIRNPDLTILDGVVAMEGEGPGSGGILRQMNLVAASPDALSLDMVLSRVMGLFPSDIPTNQEARARGVGPLDLGGIAVTGGELGAFCVNDFKRPKATQLNQAPKWFIHLFKQILKFRIRINARRCQVCGLCLKSCPAQAMALESNRVRIDDEKCLRCLCCQEICPKGAIDVEKNFLWRLYDGVKGVLCSKQAP